MAGRPSRGLARGRARDERFTTVNAVSATGMVAVPDPPGHRTARRTRIIIGAVALVGVVVSAVVLLNVYEVPPFCSIPGGTSGHECVNGVRYAFETVDGPTALGVPQTAAYNGENFQLTGADNNASAWLEINVSDAHGLLGTIELTGPGIRVDVPAWQTALLPGGGAGAQVPGEDLGHVRLLVRS